MPSSSALHVCVAQRPPVLLPACLPPPPPQCGLVAMLLCIVLAAALLHGWVMGIVAGGVALVLFTTGQVREE